MHNRLLVAWPAAALVLAVAPSGVLAQAARPLSKSDSSKVVKAARDKQVDFEQFRQSRIPVAAERSEGGCDQQIGRICIWFGGEDEADFPPERTEVELARRELIGVLAGAAEQVADPWVMGQLVHYLVENGTLRDAERIARGCELTETWWCAALVGYALHVRGDFPGAEAAFRDAIAAMPAKERERWTGLRYIVEKDAREDLEDLDEPARTARWELFWRLSDPLLLVDGNDRMTDHFARLVEARNGEDAESPQGMFWEEDVEETLIRYGRIIGYSRSHNPGRMMRRGFGGGIQDTRRVLGHHHPKSRGYLFPDEFMASPSDVPPESWITAPREARTWYAPPYAPDFRGLETQVGRFRRGDEMLVVGAYRPGRADGEPIAPVEAGAVQAGLVLVPEEGGEAIATTGAEPEGVFTLHAPPGRYVSSLEVFDPEAKRAWRARQGVKQVPLVRGLVAVSDLLILREGTALPESLEAAIPDVRPGVRIRRGERFAVVWEVYGLQVREETRVTIGFTEGRPGFLQRVGDFLGIIEPEEPVEVTFTDPGSDQVQSAFRSVELELPDLEPGAYTLHLRVDLQGRESVIASRPIVVEG